MNLGYFRHSQYDFDTTVKRLKQAAEKQAWQLSGETDWQQGKLLHVCKPDMLDKLVKIDKNLLGFAPCGIAVIRQDGKVLVGSLNPQVLGGLSQNPELSKLSAEMENQVFDLIHQAAGVGKLKPKKVKLYASTTCPYCKMEEQWLKDKGVDFDMVLVDLNQQAAQELVEKTHQMGVPVTEIEYEDMEPDYIVGFNKPQLASILGVEA